MNFYNDEFKQSVVEVMSDRRPHRRRARIIHSYSVGGANVHPTIHGSFVLYSVCPSNGISIDSAMLAGLTNVCETQTDKRTDRHTDHRMAAIWNNKPHLCYACVYRDSRQPLRYTALGTGCAHLLQCQGQLNLPPSMGSEMSISFRVE